MENRDIIATDGAHIKVMNSYDFGHFEITLGLSGGGHDRNGRQCQKRRPASS